MQADSLRAAAQDLQNFSHNLALSLQQTAIKVHYLNINGRVTAEDPVRSPQQVAERCWQLHEAGIEPVPIDVTIWSGWPGIATAPGLGFAKRGRPGHMVEVSGQLRGFRGTVQLFLRRLYYAPSSPLRFVIWATLPRPKSFKAICGRSAISLSRLAGRISAGIP